MMTINGIFLSDNSWITEHPAACPFLRPQGDRIVCTIHETSPYQCKAYRCFILRILTPDGQEVGRVNGTYGLITDDSELLVVTEDRERDIDWWAGNLKDCICKYLKGRGKYRPMDHFAGGQT